MEHNIDWLVTGYGNFLEKFGLDKAGVRTHYHEWQDKTGREDVHDYLWYLFQVILGETNKQVKDPLDLQKNLHEIYTAMWYFGTQVEGRKATDLQQLVMDTRVRVWQLELPCYFRVKLMASNCCPYCDHLDGQLFSPEDMLQHQSFSLAKCTNDEGCACFFAPVVDRDGNNQLIQKTQTN